MCGNGRSEKQLWDLLLFSGLASQLFLEDVFIRSAEVSDEDRGPDSLDLAGFGRGEPIYVGYYCIVPQCCDVLLHDCDETIGLLSRFQPIVQSHSPSQLPTKRNAASIDE